MGVCSNRLSPPIECTRSEGEGGERSAQLSSAQLILVGVEHARDDASFILKHKHTPFE
jgi:hypothetical protein